MQFPPNVEQWRPLVAKYFPAHLVDKALWVIQYESGGNPSAVGDGGAARGLFQIQDNRNFSSRPDAAFLDNPENNIAYAANQLGGASGNFAAWGENNLYNGKPFGALGNHPFPGSTEAPAPPDTGRPLVTQLGSKEQPLDPAIQRWLDANKPPNPQPAGTRVTDRSGREVVSGTPSEQAQQLMTKAEQAWQALDDYLIGQSTALFVDAEGGVVLDEFDNPDQRGTQLLREALSYQDQLQRLIDYRDAGLIQFAEDNAGAALNAAQAEADEATRAYEDYSRRIGDIFAIESAEGDRASQLQDAATKAADYHLASVEARKKGINIGDMGFAFPGQEEGQGYRDAIRSTIPAEAPRFKSVPTSAIAAAYPQFAEESSAQSTIPLGPAGFTPEDYIRNYLIPGRQPVGSRATRSGFEGY